MTIGAADVVAPVFTAPEVVVLFPAGVTPQTGLRGLFRRTSLERDDLFWITFLCVRFTWTMARLAASNLCFPTADFEKLRVRSVRERFELVFVTLFTAFAADVVLGIVDCNSRRLGFDCSRRTARH